MQRAENCASREAIKDPWKSARGIDLSLSVARLIDRGFLHQTRTTFNFPPYFMDTPTPPEDELDGLWLFDGQRERLDDALVKTRFRSPDDQSASVHGTYTRFCYHYVALRSGSPQSERPRRDPLGKPTPQPEVERISNYILEIFDEEGNFGHSEWNGDVRWGKGVDEIGAWEFSYASISLKVPPKTSPYLPEGNTLVLQPSLSLEPFGANDALPRNGADKKTPVPLPVSPGSPPPRQYVYYDPDQAQLVWVRPDLRLSLRFTQPKAALRGKAQETWRGSLEQHICSFSSSMELAFGRLGC